MLRGYNEVPLMRPALSMYGCSSSAVRFKVGGRLYADCIYRLNERRKDGCEYTMLRASITWQREWNRLRVQLVESCLFSTRLISLIGMAAGSLPRYVKPVYARFIADSHNVPKRPMRRCRLHADFPPGPFGERFRAEGQSGRPLCVRTHGYVCLCSCYRRGLWDLHLKQLSLQPDPISHCEGALALSHLWHAGSLRLPELYISESLGMCEPTFVWKDRERRCCEGIKKWRWEK